MPYEHHEQGEFVRQEDRFRDWVTGDGSSGYPAEPGRYHLYVSLACPWAHRTIIVRKLKKLEGIIGMTVVDPVRDERGWAFRDGPGHSEDPVNGWRFLSEAYTATDHTYDVRVTVPILWDTKTGRIVSNADDDLMRMLNKAFDAFTHCDLDFYPEALRPEIDTSTMVSIGRALQRPSEPMSGPSVGCSMPSTGSRSASKISDTSSVINSRKPTGAC